MAGQAAVQPKPVEKIWPPPQGQWTYEDYRQLPNDGWTYEVMGGDLYLCPARRPKHQIVGMNLLFAFWGFVKDRRLGKILTGPIDVRMGKLADPVQPDILFIHHDRLDIIKEDWVEGAPDLIVEILSPSNWIDDRRTKYQVYAQAGVREYWIVDPDKRQIEVFALRGSDYEILGHFGPGERAASEILSGFEISVDEVCPQ